MHNQNVFRPNTTCSVTLLKKITSQPWESCAINRNKHLYNGVKRNWLIQLNRQKNSDWKSIKTNILQYFSIPPIRKLWYEPSYTFKFRITKSNLKYNAIFNICRLIWLTFLLTPICNCFTDYIIHEYLLLNDRSITRVIYV